MRQKLAVLFGTLAAGLLVVRLLRRRRRARPVERAGEAPDPRADALRRQLAETRGARSMPDVSRPAGGSHADVDEERRRVHEHGRAAVEEMRRSG